MQWASWIVEHSSMETSIVCSLSVRWPSPTSSHMDTAHVDRDVDRDSMANPVLVFEEDVSVDAIRVSIFS